MDPNACLKRIADARTASDEKEACRDLLTWIERGGFAPHWALCAYGTERFVRRCGWRPSMPESFRPTTEHDSAPSAADMRDFAGYLTNCTDAQVIGVLAKERAAGRDAYAVLAEREATTRRLAF